MEAEVDAVTAQTMAERPSPARPIKVVLGKPGLDGHDRGIRLVGRALRDAGMEVVYVKFATLESIVQIAVEEDADVVGVSLLSGSHRVLLPRLVEMLHAEGLRDVVVLGGGIIPTADVPELQAAGIDAAFGPGTMTREVIQLVERLVPARRKR